MNTSNINIVLFLQVCRDIETYCAQIYRLYADGYADDPELQQLWIKTYMEEEQHARLFVMAIDMRNEKVFVAQKPGKARAESVLESIKGLYNATLEKLPSKMESLTTALRLEERLAEFHIDTVGVLENPDIKRLFHALMDGDNRHIEAIRDVYLKRLHRDKG